jgi:hypothetical protein
MKLEKTILLLTIHVFLCMGAKTPAANYVTDAGDTDLDYQTLASVGSPLDSSFDNVLFTLKSSGTTTFTTFDLSLAADGIGPGNYAILSGATFFDSGGVAPSSVQLNLLNSTPGDFFQATFAFSSSSLSPGATSDVLVLEFPLNSIAPFLSGTPFILSSANQGPATASTISPIATPEPDSFLLLLIGLLGVWGHRRWVTARRVKVNLS